MRYKIFVSGVQKELKEERFKIKEFIEGNYLFKEYFSVFLFEDLPAQTEASKKVYLKQLNDSDIYIGVLGSQYGKVGNDNLSATEREYRQAKNNKYVLVFIKDVTKRDKKLDKLILDIKNDEQGHCYKRFGSIVDLQNVIFDSLIDFLKKEGIVGLTDFDSSVCKGATVSDIDNEKITWFLKTAKGKRNYPLKINTPVKDVLIHQDLIKDNGITNSAILLFGKKLHKYHLQAKVKCIQFPSTVVEKPFTSYHIYEENLFEQVDKAVAFVMDAIKFPVIQQEHTVQVKRPYEIPVFVIHEAIVNAVAHRNYNTKDSVQVMVFVDRVEILNSGTLPSGLNIADLKKSHTSYPNNPLIADVLYLADYIQEAGSGIIEMIKQCKDKGLPEPEFIVTKNNFRVIIPRDIFTETMLSNIGLNERQLKAVKYVKEKGKITNTIYQEISNVSGRTSTRDLAQLVKFKVFDQIGHTGKGTEYILKTPQRRHKDAKDAIKTP